MSESNNSQSCPKLLNAIKEFEYGASKLTTWSLSIVGGSILIIMDTSYFRPLGIGYRYFYFLFLIGWIFIGISLYYAFTITRRSIVKELYIENSNLLLQILQKCNTAFKWQLKFFQWALLTFGVWLLLYLVWWICSSIPNLKS
jgi:hypothetical protein